MSLLDKPPVSPQLVKKFAEIEADHEAQTVRDDELLPGIRPISYAELRAMDIPPPSWRVDRLISQGGINAVSGIAGSHKTWLVADMCVAISLGRPFLGMFPTKRCKVLILDEESGLGRLKERLGRLSDEDLDIYTVSSEHLKIDKPGVAEAIIKYCKSHEIGIVVFDSLTCFHTSQENSNPEMSAVFEHFQRIAQAGITPVIIHHEPKSSLKDPSSASLRGAGDILAKCDVHISLRHRDKDNDDTILVRQIKNRDDERLPEFQLAVHKEADKTWFEYIGEAPPQTSKADVADEAIITLLKEQVRMFQSEIAVALQSVAGQKKIADRLTELTTEGKLTLTVGEHGRNYYELKA
jgi:RecA-family ATPase